MAKSLKKLTFDKINWTSTIKNFNRLTPANKLGYLNIIGKEVASNNMKPIGPGTWHGPTPLDPYVVVLGHGIIIVVIRGPRPKPFPGIGPYIRETFTEAINAKDAKFNRFASHGVQHLMLNTSKAQFEILSTP